MIGLRPAAQGYATVDDFPPLTDEQAARVVALLRPSPRPLSSRDGNGNEGDQR